MYGSFVDYILTKDKSKNRFIKNFKKRGNYNAAQDFYLPLRTCLIQLCKKNKCVEELDTMYNKLSDERKKSNYTTVISKIKEFLQNEKYDWVQPDKLQIIYGGLEISVNPELGLKIGEQTHFVKLYFKKDKISQAKVNLLLRIMQDTYRQNEDNIIVSIWDIRNGLFYSNNANKNINIPYDLELEASNWIKAWEEVEVEEDKN